MKNKVRVLLLEDEALIALDMELQIEELGYSVIGPFSGIESVEKVLENTTPDAAVLDFNLSGNMTSELVAKRMLEMGIPFAFVTGHSSIEFSNGSGFEGVPVLSKPCSPQTLKKVLANLLGKV